MAFKSDRQRKAVMAKLKSGIDPIRQANHVSSLTPSQRKRLSVREVDDVDTIAARELELFTVNDGDLYQQQYTPILKNLKNFNYYLIFWTVLAFLFIQLLYIGTRIGFTASVTDGLVFTFLLSGLCLTLWYPARYIPIEKYGGVKLILSHAIGAIITSTIWLPR